VAKTTRPPRAATPRRRAAVTTTGYAPIESYGAIGNQRTAALVGMDGSIDFLCFPRFDSPSIFAALLDDQRGGRFQLAPVLGDARQKQLYFPDSNVLLTRFLSDAGVAEIVDFMPVEHRDEAGTLVRAVKTVRGEARFRLACAPRFDYARAPPRRGVGPGCAARAGRRPPRAAAAERGAAARCRRGRRGGVFSPGRRDGRVRA